MTSMYITPRWGQPSAAFGQSVTLLLTTVTSVAGTPARVAASATAASITSWRAPSVPGTAVGGTRCMVPAEGSAAADGAGEALAAADGDASAVRAAPPLLQAAAHSAMTAARARRRGRRRGTSCRLMAR